VTYFHRFVWKALRPHLRHAGDIHGLRPGVDNVTHLTEYIVRVALRQHWDLNDCRGNTDRIRRMMFSEHSELIEMAALSNLVFVGEDVADMEVVLSVSDIGYSKHIAADAGSSQLAAESAIIEASDYSFAKSLSAGIHHTIQYSTI